MNARAVLKTILPTPLVEALCELRSRERRRRIGILAPKKMEGVVYLGSAYGGYAVPAGLVRGGVGLSFGAGEDISFEVGAAGELGATVHIFDPTPRAIEHCRRTLSGCDSPLAGRLFIHPHGVWSECRWERFYVPADPEHVSHSIVNMQNTGDYFEAQCLSPTEILRRLQLKCVSFVKLNIEGAEYEVVNAMFDTSITPDVVCITFDELHSPMDENAQGRLRDLVERFYAESYKVVHAVDSKVTFVQRQLMAGQT